MSNYFILVFFHIFFKNSLNLCRFAITNLLTLLNLKLVRYAGKGTHFATSHRA
jgi:hypothetical protein